MAEINVDQSNFESEVLASPIPVLVDFWAEWCGPCRGFGPVIAQAAEKYEGKLKVCKLNVEDAMELAEEYMISNIPAIKIFKNGEVIAESVGALRMPELDAFISQYI